LPVPFPPLAEQHRIVAKVDELMALCDELEAAQAKRERRRERLVAATLHGVNNGGATADPGARPTFQDSARFYLNHLPRLTTRPEHIQQLRQTILNLAVTEGMLFKYGSGTGSNLSCLRSSREHLSTGGMASGPVSFMKGFDAFAGVIKSGGRTRRAAKMVILDAEHPDIRDFIWCKAKEEKKAKSLIAIGYDGALDGEVYENIFFQNANNSVRVSDEFMQAAADDKDWQTKNVTDGTVIETLNARNLLGEVAQATWECGDPGLQFDTTINKWHTCKNSDRINASNPCSEFMFIDDSACNLSSLNLLKFHLKTKCLSHSLVSIHRSFSENWQRTKSTPEMSMFLSSALLCYLAPGRGA